MGRVLPRKDVAWIPQLQGGNALLGKVLRMLWDLELDQLAKSTWKDTKTIDIATLITKCETLQTLQTELDAAFTADLKVANEGAAAAGATLAEVAIAADKAVASDDKDDDDKLDGDGDAEDSNVAKAQARVSSELVNRLSFLEVALNASEERITDAIKGCPAYNAFVPR